MKAVVNPGNAADDGGLPADDGGDCLLIGRKQFGGSVAVADIFLKCRPNIADDGVLQDFG